MRRELLVGAGVLVPFAALVAAGFWHSPHAAPVPQPSPVTDVNRPTHPAPPPSAMPEPPAATARDQAADLPVELAAPLKAVLPEIRQCFLDQRFKVPHQTRVHFTPTRAGAFEDVTVDDQNPYLSACLEDVFAEVAWRPEGPETYLPAVHTFSFDPSAD